MKKLLLCSIGVLMFSYSWAENKTPAPPSPINTIIQQHFDKYAKKEYFTAIQTSIKAAGKIKTYAVGTLSHAKDQPIDEGNLFNLGSITKSFTASLMLMAQKEKKLDLNDSLGTYLDNYPHWAQISLTALLNMTSGLPNYTASPKINYLLSQNIKQFWSKSDLINLVYTPKFNPPLKSGYDYTNTGYILSAMLLESLYKKTYQQLLQTKIIQPLKLNHTFYPSPAYSSDILKRMVHGYGYNVYENPELVGRDVTENNLSWAGAAGGLVGNSEDVIHWVDALFNDKQFLDPTQRQKMTQIVSTKTGEPIKKTSKKHPRGFGLGIVQAYEKGIGRFWYYEGQTIGYRAFYMYTPCNQVLISALFNSQVNSDNDKGGLLMQSLYRQVLKDNPRLQCRQKRRK